MRMPRFIALPWRRAERIARDVDDEIAFHLDMRARELAALGLVPEDARRRAEREFGDVARARRSLVSIDRGHEGAAGRERWFAELGQDVRYAARQLLAHRAFTLVALLTLALGIGANTAIFSVVHRLLLDPLPDGVAERLVRVRLTEARQQFEISASAPQLVAWRAAHSFEHLEGTIGGTFTLTRRGEPEVVEGALISSGLLPFLHIVPALGRTFSPEETKPGGARVAMLGYGLWQRRYGGTRDAIGQTVTLDGTPFTIVGVLPPAAELPGIFSPSGAVALPLVLDTLLHDDQFAGVEILGRLRRGVTLDQARRELDAIEGRRDTLQAGSLHWVVSVTSVAESIGRALKPTLVVLVAVVGAVLLIACVNVASLMLARATARERELAVRVALGAGRWRLVRQLLVESVMLALLSGALGVLLGVWGVDVIRAVRPEDLDVLVSVRPDGTVLAFGLGLALLTALFFGLAPAVHAVRAATSETLKQSGGARGATARSRRARRGLVGAEVALSVLLLAAAGLLARSVWRLQHAEPGFEAQGLLSLVVSPPFSRYRSDTARMTLAEQIVERVRRAPGVAAATVADMVPPRIAMIFGQLKTEGHEADAGKPATWAYDGVADDYFRTLGIRLREGRAFGPGSASRHEMILSRSGAERLWPGQSVIGRRVRFGRDDPWSTIVGVVDDVPAMSPFGVQERWPQLYVPFAGDSHEPIIIVRTEGEALALAPLLRTLVHAIDADVPVRDVAAVDGLLIKALARPRFVLALFSAFAALAVVLASVGLYGVISYSVAQRTRELGIRVALGAQPAHVLNLVVAEGMRPAALGIVVGVAGALGLARFMASLLYGFSPYDLATYVGVVVVLSAVALLACWLPARRAQRVDPLAAIRAE